MSFVQEYKDVIGELMIRQMQSYIAQDILEQLDASSLNNAEQVCSLWREAISDADLWQKLYNKNMKLDARSAWRVMHNILMKRQTIPIQQQEQENGKEEQEEHYWLKMQCLIVQKFIKALEKKWREGPFYHFASPALQDSEEKKIDLSDKNCFTRSSKPIEPLQMDHMRTVKWVTKKSRYLLVRSGQEAERFEGCFCTFSRWTREPEARTTWERSMENPYKCYHISGELLVAGYYNNGLINVWNLNDQQESEKVHVFNESNDWPVVDEPNDPNERHYHRMPAWHFSSELVKLCPKGRYLASVLTGKKRTADQMMMRRLMLRGRRGHLLDRRQMVKRQLTLREFKSVSEVTVKHRLLLEDVDETRELYVDDRYVVLLYNRLEPADEGGDARILMGMVDIRSTSTFELVHSLPVGKDLNYSFHYLNGLFLTSCPAGLLKVWEVNTGLCIATISDLTLSSSPFRLVSDKYIVGFSRSEWTDGLKVWDLRALIRAGSVTDGPGSGSCALWTLPISTDREWRHLIVDEYQVYAYGRFTYPDEFGGRDYFMFALDLLDNLQDSDRRFQLQRLYQ